MFWIDLDGFGLRLVHISVKAQQSSFGSGPKPTFSGVLVCLLGAHCGLDGSIHN